MGYELDIAKQENPKQFEAHAGIDESGKGDFFGPLCVACCYVDEQTSEQLFEIGVQDSKNLGDKKIAELSKEIKRICKDQYCVLRIGNPAYNRMYKTFRNLNEMLAWGHARALENVLENVPDCPRALADQFAKNKGLIKSKLKEKGRGLLLEQRTKAESDIAVAAASILARNEFVSAMEKLSKELDLTLPKGASQQVLDAGVEILKKYDEETLLSVSKEHFKTLQKVKSLAK